MQRYRYQDGKKLRCGYTTGTCATAAAKAGIMMLLTGKKVHQVTLTLPKGSKLKLDVEDITLKQDEVCCAICKDAGDDYDVTDQLMIYARVRILKSNEEQYTQEISILGGKGIGRVTKAGLDQPVGEWAINRTPRKMITKAIQEVCTQHGFKGNIEVTIEVPGGEQIAEKTFNPRLGIEGGISILGTSGIVEPMSEQALLDTIRIEINIKKEAGCKGIIVAPGNYGMEYIKSKTKLSSEEVVKCSNFIGSTLDFAVAADMEYFLLIGHIGKLVKLGSGIYNTHSRYADGRMETLAVCGLEAGVKPVILQNLLTCNTTNEAVDYLISEGVLNEVMQALAIRVEHYMQARVYGKMKTAAIIFSDQIGGLVKTKYADELLTYF